MRLNRLLLSLSVLIPLNLAAQDIHFTQFQAVPLQINPAQAGLFEGTYRLGGLYRSQWNGGVTNGYQTPTLFVDVPIKGFRKTDWIGIGAGVFRDQAGAGALTTTVVGLNGAYHIGMDKKLQNVLSLGVSVGFAQRRIDPNKLRFADGIIVGGASRDIQAIDQQGKGFSDVNVGVNFRTKPSKKATWNFGLSAEHILGPKYNLLIATQSKLPRRFNAYASGEVALDKKMRYYAMPAAIIRNSAGVNEMMLQAVGGMKLDPKKNLMLKGGIGYRVGDALQAIAGIDFGDIKAGVAYDFTASQLRPNSRAQDGFEIAVSYIGKIFKKPQAPPVILCPRY
jgi:type IX secretion system PorP/SprF family membrane protein